MTAAPNCQLCSDFGIPGVSADVIATIAMCGHHPRYPLCLPCMEELGDTPDHVELIDAEVSR